MINSETYFKHVMQETADTLLSAPLPHQIDTLTTQQLHFLFSQIYYLVQSFPGLLAAVLLQTHDADIQFAIIDNLIDECGGVEKIQSRDPRATHSQLLKTFVERLAGTASPTLAVQAVHTKLMLANFRKLFIHSTFVEVLGAMTAMEGVSTQWFNLLHQKLVARNEFSQDDLYFFALHMVMDDIHGDILKETLMPLLTSYERQVFFRNGATSAALISKNFYLGLSEEMALSVHHE